MSTLESNEKVSTRVKIGYGLGDPGCNLFFTATGLWIMEYLTDELALSLFLAGLAVMIGRGWDVITDPTALFLYAALTFMLANTFFMAVSVPYSALHMRIGPCSAGMPAAVGASLAAAERSPQGKLDPGAL